MEESNEAKARREITTPTGFRKPQIIRIFESHTHKKARHPTMADLSISNRRSQKLATAATATAAISSTTSPATGRSQIIRRRHSAELNRSSHILADLFLQVL